MSLRIRNPMPQQTTGFVYVVEAERGVKIGWSSRPIARIDAVSRSVGEHVFVWSCQPGTRAEETAAHRLWQHLSIGDGEWFEATDDLLAWAESLNGVTP